MPAGSVGHNGSPIGPLGMHLDLDHNRLLIGPTIGPIGCGEEPTLRLARTLILFDRFLEEAVAEILEARIHADAEGVRQTQFAANDVHARYSQTTVTAQVDVHIGPGG